MPVSLGLVILCAIAAVFLTGIGFGLSQALRDKKINSPRDYTFDCRKDMGDFTLFGSLTVALIALFGNPQDAWLIEPFMVGLISGMAAGIVATLSKIFGQIIGIALFGVVDRLICPE